MKDILIRTSHKGDHQAIVDINNNPSRVFHEEFEFQEVGTQWIVKGTKRLPDHGNQQSTQALDPIPFFEIASNDTSSPKLQLGDEVSKSLPV